MKALYVDAYWALVTHWNTQNSNGAKEKKTLNKQQHPHFLSFYILTTLVNEN